MTQTVADVVLADTETLDLLRDLSVELRAQHGRLILFKSEEDK